MNITIQFRKCANRIIKQYLTKGYVINERIRKEQIGELRQLMQVVGRAIKNQELPDVAHNKPFDEGCLKAVFRVYQMDYPDYEFYDTLAASRRAFRYLENHQLHTVAAECGYRLEHHHNALADAEACAWIAREIL